MALAGVRGRELLRDLQRSDWMPQYDDETVRVVINEIDDLCRKAVDEYELIKEEYGDDEDEDGLKDEVKNGKMKAYMEYLSRGVQRNGRILHSYFQYRQEKVRGLRWETGPVLPTHVQQGILSSKELEYFSNYSAILSEYNETLGIDLFMDMEPPTDILIEILVLDDCGEILTENGQITLNKGMRLFVQKPLVEHFIRQGRCKHVRSED